jgi:hypothetical protein
MNSVQIEQKGYEMRPRDGFTVTHFLTVADIFRQRLSFPNVEPLAPLVRRAQSVSSERVKPREQNPWLRQRFTNSLGGTDTLAKEIVSSRFATLEAITRCNGKAIEASRLVVNSREVDRNGFHSIPIG